MKFEDLYLSNSLRTYDDHQRPGKTEKKLHNIPFPKNLVRALYCSEIIMLCSGCGKCRVVYCKYKPTPAKIKQARNLLKNMRYECGSSLCTFGTEGLATVAEAMAVDAGDLVVDNIAAQDNPGRKEHDLTSIMELEGKNYKCLVMTAFSVHFSWMKVSAALPPWRNICTRFSLLV